MRMPAFIAKLYFVMRTLSTVKMEECLFLPCIPRKKVLNINSKMKRKSCQRESIPAANSFSEQRKEDKDVSDNQVW